MPEQQNVNVDNLVDDDGEPLAGDALVKRLRKMVRDLGSDKATLTTKLASYETKERQASLADKFKAHGIPEKAAKFVPADADVDEWIKENADAFGGSVEPIQSDAAETPASGAAVSAEDPEAQRLAALRSSASTPASSGFAGIPENVKSDPAAFREWMKTAVTALQ